MDTGNFMEQFPEDVETEFRKALATVNAPSIEGFCDSAHDRMCEYHRDDLVRIQGFRTDVLFNNSCSQNHVSKYVSLYINIELLLPR
jgi:hypothetical protein